MHLDRAAVRRPGQALQICAGRSAQRDVALRARVHDPVGPYLRRRAERGGASRENAGAAAGPQGTPAGGLAQGARHPHRCRRHLRALRRARPAHGRPGNRLSPALDSGERDHRVGRRRALRAAQTDGTLQRGRAPHRPRNGQPPRRARSGCGRGARPGPHRRDPHARARRHHRRHGRGQFHGRAGRGGMGVGPLGGRAGANRHAGQRHAHVPEIAQPDVSRRGDRSRPQRLSLPQYHPRWPDLRGHA